MCLRSIHVQENIFPECDRAEVHRRWIPAAFRHEKQRVLSFSRKVLGTHISGALPDAGKAEKKCCYFSEVHL